MASPARRVESDIIRTHDTLRLRVVRDRDLVHIYSEYMTDGGEWNSDPDAGITFGKEHAPALVAALKEGNADG